MTQKLTASYPHLINPTKVPTYPVEINWSHPLARGLVGAWMPGLINGGWDDITGHGPCLQLTAAGNSNLLVGTPIGPGFGHPGLTSDAIPANYITTAASLHWIGYMPSGPEIVDQFYVGLNPFQGGTENLSILTVSGADNRFRVAGGDLAIGTVGSGIQHITGTVVFGAARKGYVNGILGGSDTGPSAPTFTGNTINFGNYSGNVNLSNTGFSILGLLYNRELSADEASWLYREPFVMMQPKVLRQTFFVSASNPTTGTITVTARKPTASFSGSLNETGTISATARKPTVSLSGSLNETGTISVTARKPTAVFTGGYNIAATITATARKPTVSITGFDTMGQISITARKPTVSFTGSLNESGTISVTARRPTVVLTGQLNESGTIVVTARKPTVSLTGSLNETGTIVVTSRRPTVALSGIVASGSINVTARKPMVALSGTVNEVGTITATARKPVALITGRLNVSGSILATSRKPTVSVTARLDETGTISVITRKPVASVTATNVANTTANIAVTARKPTVAIDGKLNNSGTITATARKPMVSVFSTNPTQTIHAPFDLARMASSGSSRIRSTNAPRIRHFGD